MLELCAQIPNDFGDDLLGQALAQEVEAMSTINFLWYLDQWDQGLDPKCCPHCAGLRYRPGGKGRSWTVRAAPVILEAGETSCESAAAMHTGHKRADAFRKLVTARPLLAQIDTVQGRTAYQTAKAAYTIRLEKQEPGYWHVVSYDEGERHDATEDLDR
jgi:hypothetical protein